MFSLRYILDLMWGKWSASDYGWGQALAWCVTWNNYYSINYLNARIWRLVWIAVFQCLRFGFLQKICYNSFGKKINIFNSVWYKNDFLPNLIVQVLSCQLLIAMKLQWHYYICSFKLYHTRKYSLCSTENYQIR